MNLNIKTTLSLIAQKGNLAYEYNPFHNYLTNENLILTSEGYLIPEGKAVDKSNGHILIKYNDNWKDVSSGQIIDDYKVLTYEDTLGTKIDKGSLIDLNTSQLNFDLLHPVNIEIQSSYDGSVNLILNDGKNIPRLINSRFSVRENNTYEIVDRIGENDTNIYSSENFDKDTSLYFQYKVSPKITYNGLISGILPVGQYCFYFTYCDADDNESDYIAESGVIPVFMGKDNDPYSMDGGIKNQNSNKGVCLKLSNIDASYNYLKVYYLRYFADYNQSRVVEFKEIVQKYSIASNTLNIQITGYENTEDLDPSILNISKFSPKNIKTLAQCKNMLFFGNVVKNADNYKELTDCALRILPTAELIDIQGNINNNYESTNGDFGYYNSYNMYNKVGYFNNEYYRFGVVFIYLNGTLSNVYNTCGFNLENNVIYNDSDLFIESNGILTRKYISVDNEGWIVNNGEYSTTLKLNARGVYKFPFSANGIYNITFNVPTSILKYLKEELGIRGLFFVRLKSIPTLLGQCYIMPMDNVSETPVLYVNTGGENKYYQESFISLGKSSGVFSRLSGKFKVKSEEVVDDSIKKLTESYDLRLIEYKGALPLGGTSSSSDNCSEGIDLSAFAGICPDFLLNLPYYNLIFNGSKFKLKRITKNDSGLIPSESNLRHYTVSQNYTDNGETINGVTISSVTEDCQSVGLKNKVYKLEAGKAEESYRYKYAGIKRTSGGNYDMYGNNGTNIIRGKFSPYLAIYDETSKLRPGEIYNIYLESYEDNDLQFLTRMNSSEPFYAITDRYNWESILNLNNSISCYRGDCYSNVFTYRLNRNFNDSSLPNNDIIIDYNTWASNYTSDDSTKWKDISRSDINAVKLGSWITLKVLSSYNYALRSEDGSYVSEAALMGSPRTFYPKRLRMEEGTYKMPDSYLYNDAYRSTLGYKCYFTLLDVNYIKNTFSNRIQYSSIAILDSFKNNYRDSLSTYFRDYSSEYGGIVKLVGFEGYILVIFEHGIGLATINERVLAGQGDGEPVYINTGNVLPEELTIISDTYGSQWSESIVKSEGGYVYGIDTISKKIWRVQGQLIEIISDFKVNKFLIDNILLKERELTPIIGLRNVKTHYNNNKKDLIFTFYNRINGDEEKVWSLCYNELTQLFVTFYSWLPSFSENIDTQFFTFNRDTAKWLAYINRCNADIPDNMGVLVKNIIDPEYGYTLEYRSPQEYTDIYYIIEKDHWGNYKHAALNGNLLILDSNVDWEIPIFMLIVTPVVDGIQMNPETIAVSTREVISKLTTDFYLHGNSGIIDTLEDLHPTYWYDKQHPFEFEFVVNDKIAQQKTFNNLILISNKAEPESFHFEIEGDNYEFSEDKRNMYVRQESTKELYLNLGSNMLYDRNYKDSFSYKKDKTGYANNENYYRENSEVYKNQYSKLDKVYPIYREGLVLLIKSTIFPLYYEKIDTFNDIYHSYSLMDSSLKYDFKNLSGSEIVWNKDLNQFNIVTHIKNNPINLYGRLRGNSKYSEGRWNVLIPSIIFNLKNEEKWSTLDYIPETWSFKALMSTYKICEGTLTVLERYDDYNIIKILNTGIDDLDDKNFRINKLPLILDIVEAANDSNYKLRNLDGTSFLFNNVNSIYIVGSKLTDEVIGSTLPPIVINSSNIPNDLKSGSISQDKLPNIIVPENNLNNYIDTSTWAYRKEAKIKDKWMKVRVRYSGKNLVIIHSLITLYNVNNG